MNYSPEFSIGDLLYTLDLVNIWQGVHIESGCKVHVVIAERKLHENFIDNERIRALCPIIKELNHINILKYRKVVCNETTIGVVMEHPNVKKKLNKNYNRKIFNKYFFRVDH